MYLKCTPAEHIIPCEIDRNPFHSPSLIGLGVIPISDLVTLHILQSSYDQGLHMQATNANAPSCSCALTGNMRMKSLKI